MARSYASMKLKMWLPARFFSYCGSDHGHRAVPRLGTKFPIPLIQVPSLNLPKHDGAVESSQKGKPVCSSAYVVLRRDPPAGLPFALPGAQHEEMANEVWKSMWEDTRYSLHSAIRAGHQGGIAHACDSPCGPERTLPVCNASHD